MVMEWFKNDTAVKSIGHVTIHLIGQHNFVNIQGNLFK